MVYRLIANLRGLAGYNATGAAEDAAALAAFTLETAGPNEFADALGATFATKAEAAKGEPKALGIFRAGVAKSAVHPCLVVLTGSSTTGGHNTAAANRWVNLLSATSNANPVKTLAEAAAQQPGPGVHFVNAGVNGAFASNYIDATATSQIIALTPRMVTHMIGANDFKVQRNPAEVKASIKAKIDELEAGITWPCVHLLIHPFERFDFTPTTYQWDDYRDVLRELADENPDYIAFLDISGPFYGAGIPSNDPFDMVQGDFIHLNDQGHAFMASVLRAAMPYLPTLGSASTGTSREPASVVTKTTDTFSGADVTTLAGRSTDALRGGAATPWQCTNFGVYGITAGKLVRSAVGVGFLAVPAPALRQVGLKLESVSGTIFLVVSRDAVSGPTHQVRALIQTNTFRIETMTAGTLATVSPDIAWVSGDELKLRYDGEYIETRVNNVLKHRVAAATPLGGFAGIAISDLAFTVDNFVLSEVQA